MLFFKTNNVEKKCDNANRLAWREREKFECAQVGRKFERDIDPDYIRVGLFSPLSPAAAAAIKPTKGH